MIAKIRELKQTSFTLREWAQIHHGKAHEYAGRMEGEAHHFSEELEETVDEYEEKIDKLKEENERLQRHEVQTAEIKAMLRTTIAEPHDGKVDVTSLLAIRRTIS